MAKSFLSLKQPKEMYLLALTEMCQRFGLWGVANLLVIYLVDNKKFSDASADHLFGIFTGAAFILPVLGGYIADRFHYRVPAIAGMLSTALGCFLVATGNLTALYIAIFFLSVGGGIFTPAVYTLLGMLYHNKQHLRESGFSIYYSAVNLGIFLAVFLLGALGQAKIWSTAFVIAGLVQLFGLLPFHKALKTMNLDVIAEKTKPKSKAKAVKLHPHEINRIWVILILCFFNIIFWMAYNQGGSSMNLFALKFTDRTSLGFTMPASWLLSSEPLYLVIFAIPLAKLYSYLTKNKMDPTPPMKSALSLFAMGICFLIVTIGASKIAAGAVSAAVSPSYLFIAYAFMALGEMLIAPIGLSLITHLSPRRFTAMLVGVWYMSIGVAFYLGGALAPLMSKLTNMSSFFGMFVAISFIAGFALLLLVKKLNKMRHLEKL